MSIIRTVLICDWALGFFHNRRSPLRRNLIIDLGIS
jgi:hypothetical protein